MKYILMVFLLAAALPAAAGDDVKEPKKPVDFKGNAIMCDAPYALCIKAECETNVSDANQVRCKCVMETGWSLGPNSCMDRKNNLTSTYSNKFNAASRTVNCGSNPISWAWCYGASCEKDPKDPTGKTAICRCPVVDKEAVILISESDCGTSDVCANGMWSAATPQESTFANTYFFWYMTQKNKMPAEPPAKACATE